MKASRDIQKRLSAALRRTRAAPASPIVLGRRLVSRRTKARAERGLSLEEAVNGREVDAPGGGRAFLVESRSPAPTCPADHTPESLLFFDLETTGLSSTPLFLVGVMTWSGGNLDVRQYLARDYSEEPATIARFTGEAAARGHLVSFNGKSYDLPYLRARAAATGVPFDLDLPHTDLVHAARRRWREQLPDCRLGTLEREILGEDRHDDIPGARIPEAYHAFVRTGDATKMAKVLEHNRRDLISMASLLNLLVPEPVPE